MAKYHINPETGRPGECKATVRGCKYAVNGETPKHYNSKEEAKKGEEMRLAVENNSITTMSKKNQQPKKNLYQVEVELDKLRLQKNNASPDEVKKINEQLRGKSIHLRKMRREMDAMYSKISKNELSEKLDNLSKTYDNVTWDMKENVDHVEKFDEVLSIVQDGDLDMATDVAAEYEMLDFIDTDSLDSMEKDLHDNMSLINSDIESGDMVAKSIRKEADGINSHLLKRRMMEDLEGVSSESERQNIEARYENKRKSLEGAVHSWYWGNSDV